MCKHCEVCGAELVPGVNWYTMNPRRLCFKCSGGYPEYPYNPRRPSPAGDWERLILERQEREDGGNL